MYFLLSIFSFLAACSATMPPGNNGQKAALASAYPYPQDFFTSPTGAPIEMGSTFGELRPNHFHAGLDIRPPSGVAQPKIFAAGDGYVSRISSHGGGYGQAIYITHPNGFTTLYAHLDKFSDELQQYLRAEQYAQQAFDVDLYPPSSRSFPVQQGQPIGIMGNTGHSFGKHLHFEIRKTDGDVPVNPLLFNLPLQPDVLPPSIDELKIYEINGEGKTLRSNEYRTKRTENGYRIMAGDTLYVATTQINVALKAYDKAYGASDHNGIYALQMFQNESTQPSFGFAMDEISFDQTLYINAHCDFEAIKNGSGYFNRCHRLPGNFLNTYTANDHDGSIYIATTQPTKLTFVAKDYAGNATQLDCWVQYLPPTVEAQPTLSPPDNANYFLKYEEANSIEADGLYAYFPKGTFYEPLPMRYEAVAERSSHMYSPVYRLHSPRTPIHLPFDLQIAAPSLPAELASKAFIACCNGSRGYLNCGGTWKDGKLITKARQLGEYCVMTDETPPSIRPLIVYKTVGRGRRRKKIATPNPTRLAFKISDNVGSSKDANGLTFNAYVDGVWLLMEYDSKRSLIFYNYKEGRVAAGTHQLRIVLRDAVGNETILENTFSVSSNQLPNDDTEEEDEEKNNHE